MEEELAWLITNVSKYSVALPALIGVFVFFRLENTQKVILLLVLISVLSEASAHILGFTGAGQTVVYYLFTCFEFGLLTYVFAEGIKPFFRPIFFLAIALFFLIFILIDMIWISGIAQFNSYSTAIEGLILIFFALIFFYKTLHELKIRFLEREPLFWISAGVLLYFSSSLFIFLFSNYVNSSTTALFIIWGIHGIFSILLNVFYSTALWVRPNL